MTLIIGGRRDLNLRSTQLCVSRHKSSNPMSLDYWKSCRTKAAMFVSQYETLPVTRDGKNVANINCKYLAALIRRSTMFKTTTHMFLYFRGYSQGRKRRLPGISFRMIQILEKGDKHD